MRHLVFAVITSKRSAKQTKEPEVWVSTIFSKKRGIFMGFYISLERPCRIVLDEKESEAVKIAAENLKEDLRKVFGSEFGEEADGWDTSEIVIRTQDCASKKYTQTESMQEDSDSELCKYKESYNISVRGGKLYITGSDRRGTIYGIYEFCEMLGVSPWYFWGDVPVKKKESFALQEGFAKSDHPSVEYRGIFINDEEELEAWVKNRMGEETIGVKTYEKIFELLLRLKANYIWPAMHVNSFNVKQENGALAERMGIVVGTSHCDMLMRSNNREWRPWLSRKGYENVEYDYSIPGRNREILKEYWRESVEQNRDFEVCYTLGMRGIHDSGFETRKLDHLSGETLKEAKTALLQQIIEDQRQILRETLGRDTMMTFVPYKEVLPLYDGGLKVPEDITLVWSNDNYGYIRRYPSEQEKLRKGGNGIYYHNSYWAPPGMSYVFLCSIPLAHTANELRKAYAEGIRKLWVINTGAMKPLEQEIEFFLRLAWKIGKENAQTEDVDAYVADWIDRNFSGGIGKKTAELLNDFSQLTNVRKLEMMSQNTFSQTAYGDEAAVRIHEYERLFAEGNRIYTGLPEEEKPAFFELVLMRIHAAYFTNLAFYYGDRSTLANIQGKKQAAALYTKKTRLLEDVRRKMLVYYNKRMLGGKWDGILNPEGFPPPRAAMMPVCTPPLKIGEAGMCVTLWNEDDRLTFAGPGTKWFEIGNTGEGSITYQIQAPEWLELSQKSGSTETETRVLVTFGKPGKNGREELRKLLTGEVQSRDDKLHGTITVTETMTGTRVEIPVEAEILPDSALSFPKETNEMPASAIPFEEDGAVFVRADSATALPADFRRIKRLGRGGGDLIEVCVKREEQEPGDSLDYSVCLSSSGAFLLELLRFPSLDSVGRIRIGVSVDGGEIQILESESRDEHLGNWRENVRNNVDRLYLRLPYLKAGIHTISFYAVDQYVAFSGFAIYTKERKCNNLGGAAYIGRQELPLEFDAKKFAEDFYGKIELSPRPVEYARTEREVDTLVAADLVKQDEVYAEQVTPEFYLALGEAPFAENGSGNIRIDAAAALANTPCAYAEGNNWAHCSSESYGRSGLAMYLPESEETGACEPDETCISSMLGEADGTCEPEQPSLHYRVNCSGGTYILWLLSKFDRKEESCFGVGIDGTPLPEEHLYNRGCLWRYEAEQIYRWVPIAKIPLTAGEHGIALYSPGTGLRFDRIYLTKGDELPPMDSEWR